MFRSNMDIEKVREREKKVYNSVKYIKVNKKGSHCFYLIQGVKKYMYKIVKKERKSG